MMFEISHKTLYRYSSPVAHSQHRVHMTPRNVERQRTLHHSLLIEPAPSRRHESVDSFGNPVVSIELEVPHKELVLQARSTIETLPSLSIDLETSEPWDEWQRNTDGPLKDADIQAVQYLCSSKLTTATPEIADYAAVSFTPGRPLLVATMDLTQRIFKDFKFDATATDVSTPIQKVFRQRRGVCQDFSHVALACLRSMRVAARYVSGYILTHPPPGQPKLAGADASHAWVSVWSPRHGWIDFDPTNGLRVDEEHVTIALGRDYDDISPIVGVLLGGGEHTVDVAVDMTEVAKGAR